MGTGAAVGQNTEMSVKQHQELKERLISVNEAESQLEKEGKL